MAIEFRVLMVCLGNICRSPTAEAVLRARLRAHGLHDRVEVDSAGTGGWHTGDPPDARSQRHAARRGYDLSTLRARRVVEEDFQRFDRRRSRRATAVRSRRSTGSVPERAGRFRAGARPGRAGQRRADRRPAQAPGNFLKRSRPNQSASAKLE
jgi:hypothetical protein